MLSRAFSQTQKTPIQLPKSQKVEPIKSTLPETKSNESLSSMCNFDPTVIACTPPDGYFIHNLRARMEKI